VNGVPVARQSRGTARPQAGKSTFPHQKNSDAIALEFFRYMRLSASSVGSASDICFASDIALRAVGANIISLSRSENITPATPAYHRKRLFFIASLFMIT